MHLRLTYIRRHFNSTLHTLSPFFSRMQWMQKDAKGCKNFNELRLGFHHLKLNRSPLISTLYQSLKTIYHYKTMSCFYPIYILFITLNFRTRGIYPQHSLKAYITASERSFNGKRNYNSENLIQN